MIQLERFLVLMGDIAKAFDDLMTKPMKKTIELLSHDLFDTPWEPTVDDDQGEALEPEPLTWEGWAVPAILEVLDEHRLRPALFGQYYCQDAEGDVCEGNFDEQWEWREHVAPLIAERIACNPDRAIEGLKNEKVNP